MKLHRTFTILAMLAALSACGGGNTVAEGVGTGGTGITWGTVTGFGSVFIDGVEYEDSNSPIQQGTSAGQAVDTLLALGQQVQVTSDGTGQAQHIRVLPQLLGPVTVAPSGQALSVMGVNVGWDDSTSGLAASTLSRNDTVRVFGQWNSDGTALSATRIERATPTTAVLISGLVQSFAATSVQLQSGWTVTVDSTAALNLSAGALVSFWIDANTWSSNPVTALATDAHPPAFSDNQELNVNVTLRRDSHGQAQAMGIALPPLPENLSDGQRAQLKIKRVNGAWAWVDLPTATTRASTTHLSATLSAPNWQATPLSLNLRNTPVVISAAVVNASNCASFSSGDVHIKVDAALGTEPLNATQITCDGAVESAIETTTAQVVGFNAQTQELTVESNGQRQTMALPRNNQKPANPSDWVGQSVFIEWRTNGSSKTAQRITPR
ncbi:MAG: DUF5666 domain-containing protein [Pseudomonadota bacterium]|jgi:hypothetical protein